MIDTKSMAKWLEVALAQRRRAYEKFKSDHGDQIALPLATEISAIQSTINQIAALPPTPLEEWLAANTKKPGK